MGPSSAVVSGLETRRVVFELQHIGMPNGSRVTEKGGGATRWGLVTEAGLQLCCLASVLPELHEHPFVALCTRVFVCVCDT